MTDAPDTPFLTGETFEQLLANEIWVTPTGGSRVLLADALAAAAGGSVTNVVSAAGPFLSNTTITASGTITSSSTLLTAHGVVIAQGVSAVSATAALTAGQILVGQSSADPLPKTMGGDATLNNLGQLGLVISGVSAGTYGDSTHVGQFQVDARGIVLSASNVAIAGGGSSKLTGTFAANGSIVTQLPALANILSASINNTTTIGVTVGIGTTSGATDIMDATSIVASDVTPIPAASLLKLAWTANQTIFVDSTSWAGASVNVTIWYAT